MTSQNTRSIFRRVLDNFIASRERQAQSVVRYALLSLDDRTLAEHGYRRSDLVKAGAIGRGY